MASLIPGYEYDIFISYRQKDNKYDGWVTEFVDNLKRELEATFKEEISVYFDINPHDGLLETYDVDASLKEKLKCLVFIPIISRTYCDPRSFAWEREFKAFIEQASQDKFGLKVKLPNGNVANRVLPVRIYDLDNSDIKLCESILDGVIRGVEFIYKESGVNRPLRANEDNPHNNLNHTIYRNQINKVANAIKEIITTMGQYEQKPIEVKRDLLKPASIPRKINKARIISGSIIILALVILGFLFMPKLFKSEEEPEKSIAVLPFRNYSGDPAQEYTCEGLTDEIIGHLFKIKSFSKVVPLDYVLTYKRFDKDKSIPRIANELKVNYILTCTYNKLGDTVSITAHLIDPKSDKILWQKKYDQPYKKIITIPADIALQVADKIKAFITDPERQNIQKIPTTNKDAHDLLQKALYLYRTGSFKTLDQLRDLDLKAIELDPDYADAYAWLGTITLFRGSYSGDSEMQTVVWDAASYFDKALELDQNNSTAHLGLALFNEWVKWDYITAEKEFLKAIELSPNNPSFIEGYTDFLLKRNRVNDALSYLNNTELQLPYQIKIQVVSGILSGNKNETVNAVNIYLNSKANFPQSLAGEYYIWLEEYEAAKHSLENALQNKDRYILIPRFQACLALAYFKTKDYQKAKMIITQLIGKSNKTSAGSPEYFTGWYYSGIGKVDSAFYWLEEAFRKRSAEMPWLKVDPVFKNLKNDNHYWDLYDRTGHKAYDEYRASLKE